MWAQAEWSGDPRWTRPPSVPVPWRGLVTQGPEAAWATQHSQCGWSEPMGVGGVEQALDWEPKDCEVDAPIICADYMLR